MLAVIALTASCKSIETASVTPSAVSSAPAPIVTGIPIENDVAGGILLDTRAVTAASAVPVPDFTDAGTNEISDISSQEDITEDTTADSSAADASVPDHTAEMTTAKASATTTSAAVTTSVPTKAASSASSTSAAATEATQTTAASTSASTAATTEAPAPISGSYARNSYQALNHSYVKAVWISYIELYNHLCGKSETAFRQEFGTMLDNCASIGVNTVYVHVRAFGDAYYYSSLFPFTKHISGSLGTRTSFDPLRIMVSEAHSRNISFHAWINPLRLCSSAEIASVSSDLPVGKWYGGTENGKYIVNVGGTYYLNPAYSAVRKLIGDGVREIVSGYNVDGVHIDDYFYPTTDASFDSAAFAESGYASLSSFRIENCSAMVKEIYSAAHECGSAVFGAAPQGNNSNNLNTLYADTKAWCKGGYVDYFTPQVYYGFDNSGVPFAGCVDEWAGIVRGTGTKLYAGLSVYKAGTEDKWAGTGKYEWQNTSTMLKRQKEYADANGCSGIALYSYSYLFDSGYRTAAMKTELDNLKPSMTK